MRIYKMTATFGKLEQDTEESLKAAILELLTEFRKER